MTDYRSSLVGSTSHRPYDAVPNPLAWSCFGGTECRQEETKIAGEFKHSSVALCVQADPTMYTDAIVTHCEELRTFPHRGNQRDNTAQSSILQSSALLAAAQVLNQRKNREDKHRQYEHSEYNADSHHTAAHHPILHHVGPYPFGRLGNTHHQRQNDGGNRRSNQPLIVALPVQLALMTAATRQFPGLPIAQLPLNQLYPRSSQ